MIYDKPWWRIADPGHWPGHWTRPPAYMTLGDAGPARPRSIRWDPEHMREFRLRPHP